VFGGVKLSDVEAFIFDSPAEMEKYRARLEERGIKVLLAKPKR
jgi:hypothetical protein